MRLADLIRGGATGGGLRTQLIRGAVGVGGLQVAGLALGFVASVLLARGLGPAGFGRYAFVVSLITLLAIPVAGGMRQLLTREVARCHHGEEWGAFRGILRRAHQWVALALVVVIGVLVAVAVPRVTGSTGDRWTLLLIGLAILPFLALNEIRVGALRGLRHVVLAQLPDQVVTPAIHLTVIGGLLLLGRLDPATALVSQGLAVAVAFAFGLVLLGRNRPPETAVAEPEYRTTDWARALVPFTLLVGASILNGELGIVLLGWLGTEPEIAALRVADRGAQLVVLSLGIVNGVIAPHITRAQRDGDRNRLQRLSRESARAALLLAIPVALPLIFLGAPVVRLVFGAEYVELTVVPLAILAGAQLVNVGMGSVGMFLSMTGFERDTLMGQLVALVLNAAAAVVLIPPFGATGAAWAAALGLVTWNVILGVKFVRRLGLRPGAL